MRACPVCASLLPVISVTRAHLPTMQNQVYRTREGAQAATSGELTLATCRTCGFSWNMAFDPSKLEYGPGYDNTVPSAVMERHYADVASMLGQRLSLDRGYVVDVGCGNGAFLMALCQRWPECRALGVDPAVPSDQLLVDGRLRLIKGTFSPELLDDEPTVIVLRHVLEHMPDPVAFVRELRTALGSRVGVPLYVEVPDLGWMIEQRAFWDFCYEHCNYFTDVTLAAVLASAGFSPRATGVLFGRQYRWMEAVSSSQVPRALELQNSVEPLRDYAEGEQERVRLVRQRLRMLREGGRSIVVWGMATKGIMFSLMVDPDSSLIDHTVDINANKQGCFVPISGRSIDAPSSLCGLGQRPAVVVVMNPNYLGEIASMCRAMGMRCSFLDASGAELVAA